MIQILYIYNYINVWKITYGVITMYILLDKLVKF